MLFHNGLDRETQVSSSPSGTVPTVIASGDGLPSISEVSDNHGGVVASGDVGSEPIEIGIGDLEPPVSVTPVYTPPIRLDLQ